MGILLLPFVIISFPRITEEKNKTTGILISKSRTWGICPFCMEVCTTYYSNGIIHTVENLKNNKFNGLLEVYYPNGIIECIIEYKRGKIWNIKQYRKPNNQPIDFGDLKNGDGFLKCYQAGFLRSEGVISKGYKEGIWYRYNNAGLVDSIEYLKGVRQDYNEFDNIIY